MCVYIYIYICMERDAFTVMIMLSLFAYLDTLVYVNF